MTKLNQFLNQRVRVIGVETPFEKNATIVGICSFVGINKFLNKKQITVSKCPIFLNDFNQISLFDESMSYWTGSK